MGAFLANAQCPTALAPIASSVSGCCKAAPNLSQLALPATLGAFADLLPFKLSSRRRISRGWEACHSRCTLLILSE